MTVSENLIADRNLALIGAEPAGPGWDPGTCITRSLTPKSLSETFDALAGLADKLNGAEIPPSTTLSAPGSTRSIVRPRAPGTKSTP